MAIYHCSVSVISRKGRSACAAAAYCAAEKIRDERTGLTHDYTCKDGVMHSEILAPAGTPAWATNRSELWNRAEQAENTSTRHATATTAREFIIALPHELGIDAQLASAREFALFIVTTYGVAVDFSIHEPSKDGDKRNFHVHFLLTDRRITDAGFAGKVRELNIANGGRANIAAIREQWAVITNRFLERAGVYEGIDHRSYKTQWIDREPTIHLGIAATALERRGEVTERGNFNRNVAEINAIRVKLHAQELADLKRDKEAAEIEAIEHADVKSRANSADGIRQADMPSLTTDERLNIRVSSDQYLIAKQNSFENIKPPEKKITNKDLIKEAKERAKEAREKRRLLGQDHTKQSRGRDG